MRSLHVLVDVCWRLASDAHQAMQLPSLPVASLHASRGDGNDASQLGGMLALAGRAQLPTQKAAALAAEVIALGAVHVEEMTPDEWQQLSAWAQPLPFEQRRLLKHL